jgi:hypothetical protein
MVNTTPKPNVVATNTLFFIFYRSSDMLKHSGDNSPLWHIVAQDAESNEKTICACNSHSIRLLGFITGYDIKKVIKLATCLPLIYYTKRRKTSEYKDSKMFSNYYYTEIPVTNYV